MALQAVERLIAEILRVAGDDELDGVPGPEDMVGVVRYQRTLFERLRELPRDQVLADRAVVTRYVRDQLDREDLNTLTSMHAVQMPGKVQASAFGWESSKAPRSRRLALQQSFAATERATGGQVRRAARSGLAGATSGALMAREAWVYNQIGRLQEVVVRLVDAGPSMGLSAENLDWLEELGAEFLEARDITGNWGRVVSQLRVAAADIRRELERTPWTGPPEVLAPLWAAQQFVREMDAFIANGSAPSA